MKNQSKTFQNISEISVDNQALSINRFDSKYVGQKEGYTVENQAFINKRLNDLAKIFVLGKSSLLSQFLKDKSVRKIGLVRLTWLRLFAKPGI